MVHEKLEENPCGNKVSPVSKTLPGPSGIIQIVSDGPRKNTAKILSSNKI